MPVQSLGAERLKGLWQPDDPASDTRGRPELLAQLSRSCLNSIAPGELGSHASARDRSNGLGAKLSIDLEYAQAQAVSSLSGQP